MLNSVGLEIHGGGGGLRFLVVVVVADVTQDCPNVLAITRKAVPARATMCQETLQCHDKQQYCLLLEWPVTAVCLCTTGPSASSVGTAPAGRVGWRWGGGGVVRLMPGFPADSRVTRRAAFIRVITLPFHVTPGLKSHTTSDFSLFFHSVMQAPLTCRFVKWFYLSSRLTPSLLITTIVFNVFYWSITVIGNECVSEHHDLHICVDKLNKHDEFLSSWSCGSR